MTALLFRKQQDRFLTGFMTAANHPNLLKVSGKHNFAQSIIYCCVEVTNVMKIEEVYQKLRKYEIVYQKMKKCAKSWESVPKAKKVCPKLGKCAKS